MKNERLLWTLLVLGVIVIGIIAIVVLAIAWVIIRKKTKKH